MGESSSETIQKSEAVLEEEQEEVGVPLLLGTSGNRKKKHNRKTYDAHETGEIVHSGGIMHCLDCQD